MKGEGFFIPHGMSQKEKMLLFVVLPAIFLVSAFLYIVFIVRPVLIFHHVQPPFLLDAGFFAGHTDLPGELIGLFANFLLRFFQFNFSGSVVLFSVALLTAWLVYSLLNCINRTKVNLIPALMLFSMQVILAGNYDLPFSVHLSVLAVAFCLWLFAKHRNGWRQSLAYYLAAALGVWYLCGSGYLLLFSAGALLLSMDRKTGKPLFLILFIGAFAVLFPVFAYTRLFVLPEAHKYLYFFPAEIYFKAYSPGPPFYGYVALIPALILTSLLIKGVHALRAGFREPSLAVRSIPYLLYLLLLAVVFLTHTHASVKDDRNIVASDYYCFVNDSRKATTAAKRVRDYSFHANFNHNLALLKSGRLSRDFFDFFQISGTDAICPDCEFLPDRSFVIADFYYHLGFITEARHWAYESLVYYPYSPRAMQMLVRVHLVTREYKAAARYLYLLKKGLTNRNFVREFMPLVKDTLLAEAHPEIVEKRGFMPAENELSPFAEQRFRELLEANTDNKSAYECLMLYYLLDDQPEKFMVLYEEAGNYFSSPVEMYEEAVLMYGEKTGTEVISRYNLSQPVIGRYHDFMAGVAGAGGSVRKARDLLFKEYGNSYMYYLKFIYPRIIKPEIIPGSDEEQPI